ncbi:MAG TPA: NAD(P)/FAD-dependent oxidoreductase [Candidatus Acidoferrales bacterium]|nr:NAD(P)/FAD-dependent oxidoreductase [Candidatus Acidoferrales bacterium]
MPAPLDAVVIGSGPNGLSAAVELARNGASVLVLESSETIGGGTRTAELTLPGFHHDVCSAAHPLGILSPFFARLPLAEHGLTWLQSAASVAHPLDGEPAAMLGPSLRATAEGLGRDASSYRRLVEPLLQHAGELVADVLAPAHVPRHPLVLARFGVPALLPASTLGHTLFRGERARALLAGCAAHAALPFSRPLSAAPGVLFLLAAHVETWPVARGGSAAITNALAGYLRSLGGSIETGRSVRSLSDLPPARVHLFDTSPAQMADIAAPMLPGHYVHRLRRFRYGPGVFKVDWALDGPIPWRDPSCRDASTVHLGGTLDEIAASEAAVWRGEHPDRPYVIVVQPTLVDPSRAPSGKHIAWAYCHVPSGSSVDRTDAIERQMERFAPGFRDRILATHVMGTADLERYNPNNVGGSITGGVIDLGQLFTRPVARVNPYATPNPRLFICSASTPPGGGVHGMCGYYGARTALRQLPNIAA